MNQEDVYQQLAERIFMGNSAIIPELWRMIADEEEARILLATPATAGELADKFGCAAEDMEEKLGALFRKGVLFKAAKPGGTVYRVCRDLVQFHDASILWPEAPQEFYDLWRKYMDEEWPSLAKIITKVMTKPMTRVIPVEKSLEARTQVLSADNVREIIEKSERFAVTKCTCRLTMKKCDRPIEICLQVGKAADYTVERGSGREISKEEALRLAREAEEAGLVHVTMNKAEIGHFICNCCGCCCQSFTLLISDGLPLCDPSRFRPQVEADLCSACGDCEERCWFGAIAVGDDDVAVVANEKCMGCGQCAIACPETAITMVAAREPAFIPAK